MRTVPLVARVDHPVAEGPGLGELEVERRGEGREQGQPAAEDDGRDEEPILVDQVELGTCAGEPRPADGDLAVELRLEPRDLLLDAARCGPGVALDLGQRARETTFGSCCQMRANSASSSEIDGSSSAVSQ